MESWWVTVVYSWLAATGALVAFVIFYWFAAAAWANRRVHEHRRQETPGPGGCTTIDA